MSYTKGEWKVHGKYNIQPMEGMYYLLQSKANVKSGELQANAQLISAAPELLEACKDAKNELEKAFEEYATNKAYECDLGVSEWRAFLPKAYHTLTQAITKAEGK